MVTINAAATSYALGAAMFAVLALLMLTAWRGRLQGGLLVCAAIVSCTWCLMHVGHAVYTVPEFWVVQITELVRDGFWIALLLALLGINTRASVRGSRGMYALAGITLVLLILLIALTISSRWGWIDGFDFDTYSRLTFLGHLGLSVAGIVLAHQLFRDTHTQHRWAVKFLVFGLGGLFAYDLYMYSYALLFNRLDAASWVARGVVNAMVVPFIASAAQRNPNWSVEVFVSRHVVLHSTALLGIGAYLMLMAASGYFIREYGGAWGGVVQVAFLFLALLLLLALLMSGQVRARLRVLLNKHFFKNKYDYREEWLKFTDALVSEDAADANNSEPMQNVIRAFADIVDAPRGVLWLRQSSGYLQPTSAYNSPLPAEANALPDASLVRFLTDNGWIVYVDEFQRTPGLYRGLVLPDWITTIREPWIIIPLLQGSELDGFIVLSRSITPRDLNWEDSDLLKSCGRQAASYLALLKVSEALADARQFEAFNRLSAYVVHDLKNLVAQLSLVVSNARRHMHSPGFIEDAIDTVDNASQKMNRLLMQLRKGRVGEGHVLQVDLIEVLRSVIASRQSSLPKPTLESSETELSIIAEPDRLASVLGHLIQNAQDATPDDGQVVVKIRRKGSVAEVGVVDTGSGMDARFISERLFRPFDTTKGNAGMGIGVYESREFVVAAGGHFEVESQLGEGTVVRLQLPLDIENSGAVEQQLEDVS